MIGTESLGARDKALYICDRVFERCSLEGISRWQKQLGTS